MALIEIHHLGKIYADDGVETLALQNVDLNINKGEFVAIMGPSGSGKSTLTQILGCLDRATSGDYFFDGKNVQNLNDEELAQLRNKEMGFIFQSFNLLSHYTVLANAEMPLVYTNLTPSQRKVLAKKEIALVGLSDREDYDVTKLSGGQKQRVAIARALINSPQVIFADEPTGSLDSKSGEIIMKIFEDIHSQGKTIIMVTHELSVASYAQRLIHIKDGQIESDTLNQNRKSIARDGFQK